MKNLENIVADINSASSNKEIICKLHVLLGILFGEEVSLKWKSCVQSDPNGVSESLSQCVSLKGQISLLEIFDDQDTVNSFVTFIFLKRFGWADAEREDTTQAYMSFSNRHDQLVLNQALDLLIKWLKNCKVHYKLLVAYEFATKNASQNHMARNQIYCQVMSWLHSNRYQKITDDSFSHFENLLVSGITDFWSVIRGMCVSKLAHILDSCVFSLTRIEHFFQILIKLSGDESSNWQSKEGSAMAICAIIKRFHSVDTVGTTVEAHKVKFGRYNLSSIPDFVTNGLFGVVFGILSHPQLSVREQAVKALSAYLVRCPHEESVGVFHDVIDRLCSRQPKTILQLRTKYDFIHLDAYSAEGLINACTFLIKHVQAEVIIETWPLFFATLYVYLAHPASTVRQATSYAFKYLVAKDMNTDIILKLVLSELCNQWPISLDAFSKNVDCSIAYTRIGNSWEWMEGHLLSYELIFQVLIKNHSLYTFGQPFEKKIDEAKKAKLIIQQSVDESRFREKLAFFNSGLLAHRKRTGSTSGNVLHERNANMKTVEISTFNRDRARSVDHGQSISETQGVSLPRSRIAPRSLLDVIREKEKNTSTVIMRSIETILLHCISCLGNTQWELRRMSLQALPVVSEVARWYEPTILTNLWSSSLCDVAAAIQGGKTHRGHTILATLRSSSGDVALPAQCSFKRYRAGLLVLAYGHCLTVQYSVQHAVKMSTALQGNHPSWQESAWLSAASINDFVSDALPSCLSSVQAISSSRLVIDRLSIVCWTVVATSVVHFPSLISENEKNFCQKSVCKAVSDVVSTAHKDMPRLTSSTLTFGSSVHIADSGFLSCTTSETSSQPAALQAEKLFLDQLRTVLVNFFKTCPTKVSITCLPYVTYLIGVYQIETPYLQMLLDSTSAIIGNLQNDKDFQVDEYFRWNMLISAKLVNVKGMTLKLLKQVFGIIIEACRAGYDAECLKPILKELCVKLNQEISCPRPPIVLKVMGQNAASEDSRCLTTPAPDNDDDDDDDDTYIDVAEMAEGNEDVEMKTAAAAVEVARLKDVDGQILGAPRDGAREGSTDDDLDKAELHDLCASEHDGSTSSAWDSSSEASTGVSPLVEASKEFLSNLRHVLEKNNDDLLEVAKSCLDQTDFSMLYIHVNN